MVCLWDTSPSTRDVEGTRMPTSAWKKNKINLLTLEYGAYKHILDKETKAKQVWRLMIEKKKKKKKDK